MEHHEIAYRVLAEANTRMKKDLLKAIENMSDEDEVFQAILNIIAVHNVEAEDIRHYVISKEVELFMNAKGCKFDYSNINLN